METIRRFGLQWQTHLRWRALHFQTLWWDWFMRLDIALGGECHIPHGDAMNILLPYVMRYNQSILDEQYGELLIYFAGADVYAVTPKQERGKRMIQEVRKLQSDCIIVVDCR